MQISSLNLGKDITKVRTQLKPNMQMLRNRTFAFDFLKLLLDKTSFKEEGLLEKLFQQITDEQLTGTVDLLIEKINNSKFEVNALMVYIIELLYSLNPQTANDNLEILNKLSVIINQRHIITDGFKDIDITESDSVSTENYDFFFTLMLRQTALQQIHLFLDEHDEKYEGDFISFLNLCLIEYQHVLNPQSVIVAKDWLNQHSNRVKGSVADIHVKWTGDENNKNQFVQLVYGMFKAKLLNHGEGEVTKVVEDLSELLKVGLNKTWQANHSNSIHLQNNDYAPVIFDKIKTAYAEHADHLKKAKKTKSGKN